MLSNNSGISSGQLLLFPLSIIKSQQLKLKNDETRRKIRREDLVYGNKSGNSNRNSNRNKEEESVISSSNNGFVKHCVKLRLSSSYRHSHRSALLIGSTPIREMYNFYNLKQELQDVISCLLVLDKAEVPHGLNDLPVSIIRVSSTVMNKLSGLQSSDSLDAIAVMKIPSTFYSLDGSSQGNDCCKYFPSPQRILVLDGIQDPGNLGTLLRSAMAFGWGGIFLLPGCCDPFNEKAVRASRGASFQIPIVSGSWTNLEDIRNEFHLKVLAGHPESTERSKPVLRLSQELAESLVQTPLCLVLGSEGSGLSEKTKQLCALISIPMAGDFESLNVSVAGGIFLYMLQPPKG